MTDLSSETCAALTKEARALSGDEIEGLKAKLFGWEVIPEDGLPHLCRTFKFKNFTEAIRFADEVAERADQQDHHPRLTVEWGKVKVEWWTHVANGLHRNDFIMAAKTDKIIDHWQEIMGKKDKVQEASEESFPASDPPAIKGERSQEFLQQQYGEVARMDNDES